MKISGQTKKKNLKKRKFKNSSSDIVSVTSDLAELAREFVRTGKQQEALNIYKQICKNKPASCDDYLNIAIAQKSLGNILEASKVFREGMLLYPYDPALYLGYGEFLGETGKLFEALSVYDKAISLSKERCQIFFAQAAVCYRLEEFEQTKILLRSALTSHDICVEYAIRIGNSFFEFGDFQSARNAYEKAICLDSMSAIAHANRGAVLLELGKLEDALTAINQAIKFDKSSAQNLYNRALIWSKIGNLNAAISDFKDSIRLEPENKFAYFSLSSALFKSGDLINALAAVDSALKIDHKYGAALSNKGVFLVELSRFSEAKVILADGVKADPACVEINNSLGHVLMLLGELSASEEVYRRTLKLDNKNKIAASNFLFLLNYMRASSGKSLKKEAIQVSERFLRKFNAPISNDVNSAEKPELKIGFVSGDLYSHPVGCFLQSVLESIDSTKISICIFYNFNKEDNITEEIRKCATIWENIYFTSDEDVALRIRAENIDILFDLSGHTDKNRLSVFAYKPAPVQISWLGYCGTTGLSQIDYILGDPYVTPENEEDHFVEKIWRLPETYWCFTSPQYDLKVEESPALNNGYITFGCFNNLSKINEGVIELWARILEANPDSKLFLKTRQFSDKRIEAGIREKFCYFGIKDRRLIVEGQSSGYDYLKTYNRVDIALDPFPFPGGTTSIEGLWMGVPFITKKGSRFYSHNGETILHNVGLPEWIAVDDDEYVLKAITFSRDLESLAELRRGLRAQILASPLFDAERFARNFEEAMFAIWQKHCSEEKE